MFLDTPLCQFCWLAAHQPSLKGCSPPHLLWSVVFSGQQGFAQLDAGCEAVVSGIDLRLDALMVVHQQLHWWHVSEHTRKHTHLPQLWPDYMLAKSSRQQQTLCTWGSPGLRWAESRPPSTASGLGPCWKTWTCLRCRGGGACVRRRPPANSSRPPAPRSPAAGCRRLYLQRTLTGGAPHPPAAASPATQRSKVKVRVTDLTRALCHKLHSVEL